MKKILIGTWAIIKWIICFLFTLEARNRYAMGEMRGMHCYKSESGKELLGQSTDFYYDPTQKPERDYLTLKEFWKIHYTDKIK